ncbi:lysin A [Pseudomonas phage MiCath]|uniref:Lysin A n=1 Tax=Pseudomonas phage MiCath TaxID=3003729 RepID=A0AAF0AEJ5_9CAUD|nr:lysin A [Pseudomonas phage MiCath]WAX22360.1 lysin A [Pseudomonas phage MiCath]
MSPTQLKNMLDAVMKAEGWDKYTNNPNDKGGPTKWGITQATARAFGYTGDMQKLEYEQAFAIYKERYWFGPKYDQVDAISANLATILLDFGVNSGTGRASKCLQRALNTLNRQAKDYPDIETDGALGRISISALSEFAKKRGASGLVYLAEMVKAQRSVFLMEISERDQSQEEFSNGWQQRVFKD